MNKPYIGRFAPSPTGKLHLGSLFAAVASWLHAKQHQGQWLVRMEDLDPPREEPGAADHILQTLKAWGLESDAPVLFQSHRHQAYQSVITQLLASGLAYRCSCSRKQVAAAGLQGPEGWRYNGHCRTQLASENTQHCIRLNTKDLEVTFDDELQGLRRENPEQLFGDFPIRRADGFYAYQLAVVLDDAAQGVTHVVRGIDIMSSTSRQIALQQRLGLQQPQYCHLPVLSGDNGQKLSKQNLATPIPQDYDPALMLWVLEALGMKPPQFLHKEKPQAALIWATEHWQPRQLLRTESIPVN